MRTARQAGRAWFLVAAILLAVLTATLVARHRTPAPTTIVEQATPGLVADGITPFRLGGELSRAAQSALPYDTAAAYVGPGRDDRNQVTVVLPVGGADMTVMAMEGEPGLIGEIIATPDNALSTRTDRSSCLARTRTFAASLAELLGPPGEMLLTRQPVSDEFLFPFGDDAAVIGRWFAGGQTCDLALIFKRSTP